MLNILLTTYIQLMQHYVRGVI